MEATYCKLNQLMMDLEGKPKPFHHFNDSITKFKEKVQSRVCAQSFIFYGLKCLTCKEWYLICIYGHLTFIKFNQEVEHSIANLPRPVRMKRTTLRSCQALRTSINSKAPAKNGVDRQDSVPAIDTSRGAAKHTHKRRSEINEASSRSHEECK